MSALERSNRVTIIGAGLAGLAAAVRCARADLQVQVLESAGHAGGRCRSLYDETLDRTIDNGSHLIVGANGGVFDFLHATGAKADLDRLPCRYPFTDLSSGQTWTLRPGLCALWDGLLGKLPFSLHALRRGMQALENAAPDKTVKDCLPDDEVFAKLWGPMTVSVLNTPPETASAQMLGRILKATIGQGALTSRPYITPKGLGPTLIDPALASLKTHGAHIRFNTRVTGLLTNDDSVTAIGLGDETLSIGDDEKVILAVPASVAGKLLPSLTVPDAFVPIVNAHFRIDDMPAAMPPITGLTGGTGEWLFVRDDVVSVTVSAAFDLAEKASDEIAAILWADACKALNLGERPMGPAKVIKEKRATIAHSPEQLAKRPPQITPWANLMLAGDWTESLLPCTIEAAIASGHRAADKIIRDFLKK